MPVDGDLQTLDPQPRAIIHYVPLFADQVASSWMKLLHRRSKESGSQITIILRSNGLASASRFDDTRHRWNNL
jgi:hypothetical protein